MSAFLPIEPVIPQLLETFRTSRNVALSAPPGAGKTTRVPLALLDTDWMAGKRLIILEPRRLAARRSAQFMSSQIGERVGATVGYRTRGDSRTSASTRIEVVTEGVLTRLLHAAPDLPGVALVIFDEFHERSIHADLGLALTLEVQESLRDDLRILVMSATLDGIAVSRLLGNAPVIESPGRSFPIDTRYLAFPHQGHIEPKVAEVVKRAIQEEDGDVLVFLPGQREIRRVETILNEANLQPHISVHSLYGEANDEQQQAALSPAPRGTRKVILSTNIAETSLTIDGVRVVVDSGLARSARFDSRRGMSGLVTIPVSRAAADQRRGRAGRQQPGACYRIWTEQEHEQLQPWTIPEILVADLAPLALDLALWGSVGARDLRFLDPPPEAHLAQARRLLQSLGALDDSGAITPHGRSMAGIPVHPRLAHMIIRGKALGAGYLACEVAALLEERDILRGEKGLDIDLNSRLHALRSGKTVDRSAHNRVLGEIQRLSSLAGVGKESDSEDADAGILLALAYPERIARRREAGGRRYRTAGGTGAILPEWSLLAREEFLAIADVDGVGTEAKVFLAAPVQLPDLLDVFGNRIVSREEVIWDSRNREVIARQTQSLDALVLAERKTQPSGEPARTAMLEGIREMGLQCLPWNKASDSLRGRSEWLRGQGLCNEDWPDLSDEGLMNGLQEWLGPFLNGFFRREHLDRLDMQAVLKARFTHAQLRDLDRQAPVDLKVPTGSRIKLDYPPSGPPVLAVKLQEMFGQTDTPTVANGNIPVLIHLLSPAGRPLAVTQDLRSFWANVYPEVRKQMRGRYSKHPWPEDPLNASPTRRTKRS